LFIHFSTNGHLGYLHLLTTMNDVTVDKSIHISLQDPVFSSLGCMPRSGLLHGYFWIPWILIGKGKTVFYCHFGHRAISEYSSNRSYGIDNARFWKTERTK
jgi:hypothetical protein